MSSKVLREEVNKWTTKMKMKITTTPNKWTGAIEKVARELLAMPNVNLPLVQ
jgi:hypothetical protein